MRKQRAIETDQQRNERRQRLAEAKQVAIRNDDDCVDAMITQNVRQFGA